VSVLPKFSSFIDESFLPRRYRPTNVLMNYKTRYDDNERKKGPLQC